MSINTLHKGDDDDDNNNNNTHVSNSRAHLQEESCNKYRYGIMYVYM
jgi:hypothetical protein